MGITLLRFSEKPASDHQADEKGLAIREDTLLVTKMTGADFFPECELT